MSDNGSAVMSDNGSAFPLQWKRHYVGGNTPSEVFTSLLDTGKIKPITVENSLEVAARLFEDHAANLRGLATAAAEGDESQGPVHILAHLAVQFEQQAIDAFAALAFLRGDNEPVKDDE